MNIKSIYKCGTLRFRDMNIRMTYAEGLICIHNLKYPKRIITFQMDKGYCYTHYTDAFLWLKVNNKDTLVRSLKHLKKDCVNLKEAMELIMVIHWLIKWIHRAQTNFMRRKLLKLSPLPNDLTKIIQAYCLE